MVEAMIKTEEMEDEERREADAFYKAHMPGPQSHAGSNGQTAAGAEPQGNDDQRENKRRKRRNRRQKVAFAAGAEGGTMSKATGLLDVKTGLLSPEVVQIFVREKNLPIDIRRLKRIYVEMYHKLNAQVSRGSLKFLSHH